MIKSFFSWISGPGKSSQYFEVEKIDEASPEKIANARDLLDSSARVCCFGELGGFRPPDTNDRFTSWWGGNFLSLENEDIPVCRVSGKTMIPVLQIRIDELPQIPKVFKDIALLTLWFDPEAKHVWEAKNGSGFMIRTYPSLQDLSPIGQGYKEHPTLPTFPIKWNIFEHDLPNWEQFADNISPSATRSRFYSGSSDWFGEHHGFEARSKMQKTMPIKLGGWSEWWQSPQEVENGEFAFLLDSTPRGSFGFPGGGIGNFFRVNDTWELRVDCL